MLDANAAIYEVHPGQSAELSDAQLLALYAPADRSQLLLRANFISSIDGSATAGGLSGKLGAPADKRVFDVLRQLCDVVIVGAGTARAEGYGAMRVGADAARWRLANGLAEHPSFAIVSASLNLDPRSDIFVQAPVRPLVLTSQSADPDARARLEKVADVVDCGERDVEPQTLVSALVDRGFTQLHCEGGPSLLGSLIVAGVLDELCLSISPALEGGIGKRISRTETQHALTAMTLKHILLSGSMMFTRYARG